MPFFALWLYIENNRKFDHPSLLAFSAVFMFSFAYVSACMFFRALFSACIIFPRFQPTWSWPKFTLKLLHCGFYAFVATGKLGIKKKKESFVKRSVPSWALSCVWFLFLASLSVLDVVLVQLFPPPLQLSLGVLCELHDLCEKCDHNRHKTEWFKIHLLYLFTV